LVFGSEKSKCILFVHTLYNFYLLGARHDGLKQRSYSPQVRIGRTYFQMEQKMACDISSQALDNSGGKGV
jgi:hypothetical protein